MTTSKQRQRQKRQWLFRKHFYSKHRVTWFKNLKCEVTGSENCVNAHMKSRGAGGTYKDIVPLSWDCHHDFDTMPMAKFEKKYSRTKESIRARAEYYQGLWEQEVDRRKKAGKSWK
tara:strand:+ start:2586 stop:2933 length:348 start_codon:yes stop_codon:yes gene_type:complete